MILLVGFGLSSFLLAAALSPLFFAGSDFATHSPEPSVAYFSFLVLNPPLILLHAFFRTDIRFDEIALQAVLFAVSFVWWLAIAVVFRRRHARPFETAVV
jgi:hypothetical protein